MLGSQVDKWVVSASPLWGPREWRTQAFVFNMWRRSFGYHFWSLLTVLSSACLRESTPEIIFQRGKFSPRGHWKHLNGIFKAYLLGNNILEDQRVKTVFLCWSQTSTQGGNQVSLLIFHSCFYAATGVSFTVGSKLLFHPHILPQPGGLLMSSPLCPQEENQKLAEGWGQCIEVLRCLWRLPSTFCSLPCPTSGCPAERAENTSCSSTEKRLPPPCKSLQRMSEGQKFSPHPEFIAFPRLQAGTPERKGPGRWDGLWPVRSRPAVPFVTLTFPPALPSLERPSRTSLLLLCFSNCVTPKRDLVWCLCVCKSHSREIPDLCKGSLEKHCLFLLRAAELPGSSRTSPRSYVSWLEQETSSCPLV